MRKKRRTRVLRKKTQNNTSLILFISLVILLSLVFLIKASGQKTKTATVSNPDPLPCYQEGKRYPIDKALKDFLACDIEITSGEDFAKLAKNSKKLTNVRSIYFRKTPNTKIPPQISNLTNLQTLNFHHTFKTSFPKEIGKLKNLTTLNFSKADIKIIPSEITRLQNLTNLSISENTEKIEIPDVSKLGSLKVLSLTYNAGLVFSDKSLENLSIEEVNLSNSKLSELPPFLFKLKNLKLLVLSENEINAATVEKIRQALPSTNIIY